jgi:AcrR family transcriptional regulator
MSAPTAFSRARSDEQRAERKEAILATAATMLQTSRVNQLTLNELARQVGLAKSNVLRYFESREAVLLELLQRETSNWMDALEARLVEEHAHDVETIARAIADTAASRPILCDLSASSAGVLEHNVSAQVATEYKRAAIAGARRLADIVGPRMGGFSEAQSIAMVAGVTLIIGGVGASSQPSPGLAAAYDANPDLRMMQIPLSVGIRELVATLLVGLQHREPSAT